MRAKARMGGVEEPADGCLLDGAIHPFDLAVGPRMVEFREPMVDTVLGAREVKGVRPKALTGREHLPNLANTPAATWLRELKAVVGEHGVDPVRDVFKEPAEEVRRDPSGRAIVEFRKGELADPIDGHEQIQLALLGPDLGEIDVDVAQRIGFERLARPTGLRSSGAD